MFIVVQFCELLLDPMNGAVNTTDTLEGSVAGYSCMQGYILSGDETRVCQRNTNTLLGVWSGTEPICIRRIYIIYNNITCSFSFLACMHCNLSVIPTVLLYYDELCLYTFNIL